MSDPDLRDLLTELRITNSRLKRLETDLDKYTPLLRYLPIERIVYGLVSLILIGVVGAILTLVLKR